MIVDGPNGYSGVVVFGADGKRHGKLVATRDSWARLVFVGEDEKARISMGMGPDDEAAMTVYDQNESIRIAAGIGPDDVPVWTVRDEHGKEIPGQAKSPEPDPRAKPGGRSSGP
jgi:hypothetical protein